MALIAISCSTVKNQVSTDHIVNKNDVERILNTLASDEMDGRATFTPGIEKAANYLEEILKKLNELQQRNNALLKKYNGDSKFARVHKRIKEENTVRKAHSKEPIVSDFDMQIMSVLLSIKTDIDQKVYDRNDILKKDAFFEQTVMTQIKEGMDRLNIPNIREDRVFIQNRITRQYLNQYNETYMVA